MVDYAREYVDELSPEGLVKLCERNNATLEDLTPRMNSHGTRIGNLTRLEEVSTSPACKLGQSH